MSNTDLDNATESVERVHITSPARLHRRHAPHNKIRLLFALEIRFL
jgi:hypothetical protein